MVAPIEYVWPHPLDDEKPTIIELELPTGEILTFDPEHEWAVRGITRWWEPRKWKVLEAWPTGDFWIPYKFGRTLSVVHRYRLTAA